PRLLVFKVLKYYSYVSKNSSYYAVVIAIINGNFQQYPQMLIITVSNQLQGITLQGIGGQGFSDKNTQLIHGHVQQFIVRNTDCVKLVGNEIADTMSCQKIKLNRNL
ncbi:MAG: hypothetical protein EZS28_032445, partial [Streblomastix strix]